MLYSQPKSSAPSSGRSILTGRLEVTRLDDDIVRSAGSVLALAEKKGLGIVTAESCTGGLVASALSEAPGAGTHLHGGFVVYTKVQKTAVLGVPATLLAAKGAVCFEVARAMAEGALRQSPADVAVAVTGVAGPSTDEDGNPVGLLCLSALRRGSDPIDIERRLGAIGRGRIRYAAVAEALALLGAVLALGTVPATPIPESRSAADSL